MSAFSECNGFLTEDVVVPALTTVVISDAIKKTVNVREAADGVVYLFVQGNGAGAVGTVRFFFQRSPNGTDWFDVEPRDVTLDGTNQVNDETTNINTDLTATDYMRLDRVENQDAAEACTINAGLDLNQGDI
jgi:hypothetical protein